MSRERSQRTRALSRVQHSSIPRKVAARTQGCALCDRLVVCEAMAAPADVSAAEAAPQGVLDLEEVGASTREQMLAWVRLQFEVGEESYEDRVSQSFSASSPLATARAWLT